MTTQGRFENIIIAALCTVPAALVLAVCAYVAYVSLPWLEHPVELARAMGLTGVVFPVVIGYFAAFWIFRAWSMAFDD